MSDEIPLDEWKKCKLWIIHFPENGEVMLKLQRGNKITGHIMVDNLVFLSHPDYYIKRLADEYNLHKGGEDE